MVAFVLVAGHTSLSTMPASAQSNASEAETRLVARFNDYTDRCIQHNPPLPSAEACEKDFKDLEDQRKAQHLSIDALKNNGANPRSWIDRVGH
jgi:hypothetical protein